MASYLIRKLEQFTKFSSTDRQVLEDAARARVRHFRSREDIIREGDEPRNVNLFLGGWACRYKSLEDGRRQIMSYFIPGDLCDLNIFVLRSMDHSILALTPVTVAEISRDLLEDITVNQPRITQALWWESLVTASIQREWTVNLGQRTAFERIAHLLCELFFRLRAVGLTQDNTCEIPLTQVDIGETVGLSTVHVNRTLQELRGAGLITLRDKILVIHDLEAMQNAALFNPNYLHLNHVGRHLDANVD